MNVGRLHRTWIPISTDPARNGDVSWKEFRSGDEQFCEIDASGDGLTTLEEALRFAALLRKSR